jgi:tetratricopeptide (TPR) repeat protein
MVGADGRVRLMDFGLARSGAYDLSEETHSRRADRPARERRPTDSLSLELTHAGAILGTPAYMAPEQFAGVPADARTDQFGWCVTCWEALFGQRPFAGASLIELALAVTTGAVRPPPPSSVPRWLRRALERGMRPDPQARFASMDALLAELARGQGRTRRWLRGLAVATAVTAALGLHGTRQLRAAEAVAACDTTGAALEQVWNDDVRAGMARAFTRANPRLAAIALDRTSQWLDRYAAVWKDTRTAVCREATVEHTRSLERAVAVVTCLEEQRTDLETIVGVLVEADAEVVQRAAHLVSGLAPASICLLEARAPRPAGLEHGADRARAVALRRKLVRTVALEDTGKFDAGLAVARDVLLDAGRQGLDGLRAEALMRIGNLHERRGDAHEAERALEDAVFLASAGGHDETVAEAASMLAFTLSFRQGRHDDALRWARLSQAALRRLGAEDSLRAARLHSVLGTVHRLRGDLDAALDHARRALALRESLLGLEHPDTARALNTLGNVALARRDFDLAVRCHERALEIRGNAYGIESHDVATSMKNLGDAHLARGAPDDAFMFHNDALALRERLLGPSHPDVAAALIDLGRTQQARREHLAARAAFTRAAELREAIAAPAPARAEAWTHVGESALDLGDPAQAADALERALALHGDGGPPSARRAETLALLAHALRARGDVDRANATARAADLEAARAARER